MASSAAARRPNSKEPVTRSVSRGKKSAVVAVWSLNPKGQDRSALGTPASRRENLYRPGFCERLISPGDDSNHCLQRRENAGRPL